MTEPAGSDDDDHGSPHRSLIGLIVVIVLVVGGYFLVQKLKAMSELQDCVMSGRSNCAPIDANH